jgi:hypothetical protein
MLNNQLKLSNKGYNCFVFKQVLWRTAYRLGFSQNVTSGLTLFFLSEPPLQVILSVLLALLLFGFKAWSLLFT